MHTAAVMLGSSIIALWALGSTFASAVIHKLSGI
jgi:hypothetical protein